MRSASLALVLLSLLGPLAAASDSAPALVDVRPNRTELPSYERFELAVTLEGQFANPFDPEAVALDATFTTPSGRTETIPGFFWQGFERSRVDGAERLKSTGESGWQVRYRPTQPGEYQYRVVLRVAGQAVGSREGTFRATGSGHPGFVRIAKGNPRMFEYDDGSPYFAVGENVCWPGKGATYEYDNYWTRLAEQGANYARLWIGPFDAFTLERASRGPDDPAGLGRYDQEGAWRIDYVLDQAEAKGIRILFCIDSFNSLRITPPYAMWKNCPYNAALGGPIERPEQFFTNETARKLFRNRLRYIAARWAHSPSIFAWEFWNEVNIIEKYVSADSAAWHAEMARALRAADPHRHLITTSWAGFEGDPAVDALPEMDFIQSHQYGARDPAALMIDVCRRKARDFRKPHYFGEFGTGTEAEGTGEDREGVHLHNGLWSGVVSGAAGTAMLWWWDSYVEPNRLYRHFGPVVAFTKDIPYHAVEYRPATIASIAYAGDAPPPRWEDWTLPTERGSWEPAPYNEPVTFAVSSGGEFTPAERLAKVLHGVVNHPTLHNPPTFQVDYAQSGQFVVDVAGVSGHGGAKLKVYRDDQLLVDRDFADTSPSTDNITEFDGAYPIDVPAGRHAIRVVNDGKDWMYVSYTLKGYRRRTDPALQVWALAADAVPSGAPAALVWLKNERYTWYNCNRGEPMREIPATRIALAGLPEGAYHVEWWDTYTGEITRRDQAACRDGRLPIDVPPLARDAACKVFPAGTP